MLKKCVNLRKFIKFIMGKWSEFDLGKLCLFSPINKGKWIMIRKHLARSVHVGSQICSWNWRLFWLWHQVFFPFLGLPLPWLEYKLWCRVCSFQGSLWLTSLLLVPGTGMLPKPGARNLMEANPSPWLLFLCCIFWNPALTPFHFNCQEEHAALSSRLSFPREDK